MLTPEERINAYKAEMKTQTDPHYFANGHDFEKCSKCETYYKCFEHEAFVAYEEQLKMYISKLTHLGPSLLCPHQTVYWVNPDGEILETEVARIDASPDAVTVLIAGELKRVSPEDLFMTKEEAAKIRRIRKILFNARFAWEHKGEAQRLADELCHTPYFDFVAYALISLYNLRIRHLVPKEVNE